MSTYDNSFSNFGRPLVSEDLCKDSAPRHSWFWRRRFLKVFYLIWAWRPSWSLERDNFSNPLFPYPKVAPYEIWVKLAQRLQRRSRLKFSTIFPFKCMGLIQTHREANLTLPQKGQTSTYDNFYSNFGRPPVPDDSCKDSALRLPRFWIRSFLKNFTIYGHGGHLGHRTATILAIFRFPSLRRLQMKFEQNWLSGFRGEVVWKC